MLRCSADDAGHHLLDARIGAPRVGVDLVQDGDLRADRNVGGGDLDRVEVARRRAASGHGHRARRGGSLRDRPGGGSGEHRAAGADLVGVGVALALAGLRADADALLQVAVAALDDALLEHHRVASRVLEEEVRVIDPPREGGLDAPPRGCGNPSRSDRGAVTGGRRFSSRRSLRLQFEGVDVGGQLFEGSKGSHRGSEAGRPPWRRPRPRRRGRRRRRRGRRGLPALRAPPRRCAGPASRRRPRPGSSTFSKYSRIARS